MKKLLVFLLVVCMAVSAVGCNVQNAETSATTSNATVESSEPATSTTTDSAASAEKEPWNIAFFTMAGSGEFWASVMAGAEKACKEYGVTYTISGPDTETSYEQQISMVEDAITKGAQAICIAVCDAEALVPTLEAAAEKGIKIILFNTSCNYQGLTFIATDNYAAGQLGGKALGEALGGKGKVCLLGTASTVPSNVDRCEGAKDYLNENFPDIEVVDTQYCEGDMEKAISIANDWITSIPDLAGIFSNNDYSTIAVANVLEERGKAGQIKHVGFDATETNVVYLESGTTTAIVTQDPGDIGYQSIVCAIKALEGETLEPNIGTNILLVTKDNLNDADVREILGF